MSTPSDSFDAALGELITLEELASRDTFMQRLHPGSKLLVTILFILTAVSFPKENLSGLLALVLYPMVLFQVADLSFRRALYRCRIVLPLVCAVGIANPFLDRRPFLIIGSFCITYGLLTMLTLMLKGVLSVLASYLLIATTSMENLCHALYRMHVPSPLVVELLLIYRYITLFLEETKRVVTAYHLRAPGQKGIAYKAIGPLLGQLLLRTIDRAERVYQSMQLRGFRGDFSFAPFPGPKGKDIAWVLLWGVVFVSLRTLPILESLGGLLLH